MTQSSCGECGFTLGEDDQFCGNCGTPAPNGRAARSALATETRAWGGTTPPAVSSPAPGGRWGQPPPVSALTAQRDRPRPAPPAQAHTALSARFFGHAAGRPTGRPSNPTRYLCAAAYLNPWYANQVVGELVASHRAVAPSVDIDLGPIVRHCLHARRIALIRDAVLTCLLVAGLILALVPTIAVLAISFGLGMLRGPAWQRRSVGAKVGVVAGIAVVLVGVVVLIGIIAVVSQLSNAATSGSLPGTAAAPGPLSGLGAIVAELVAFLVLMAATVAIHTYAKYRTLSDQLRPDAQPTRFSPSSPNVEARIAQVEAAQWGNVTLYAGENPFIGTGKIDRAWSLAIELDRARPASHEASLLPASRRYVSIDPVELHQVIRERLIKLNDPKLPVNERVSALIVEDHIIGEGLRSWDGPLLDPAEKVPYSQADPEAIAALTRHPQAGLRYYQRLSVSDRGQAVHSAGQEVIAGVDQEVAVSAFVYVAVEGRMLYLQFVTTVLPPIQHRYHIIDRLPKSTSSSFMTKVLLETATSMFGDLIGAPILLFRTLRLIMREQQSFAEEASSSEEYLFGDVGTRESVRELGASSSPHTYIQVLDSIKYTKIIERMLTDTVFDFLRAKGVDTSAYVSSVAGVVNNSTLINYAPMTGPVAVGPDATATQTSSPAPGS